MTLRTITAFASGVPVSEKVARALLDAGFLRETNGELYLRDGSWGAGTVRTLLQDVFISAFHPGWHADESVREYKSRRAA